MLVMANYEYDIFISYRRPKNENPNDSHVRWIKIFMETLSHFLRRSNEKSDQEIFFIDFKMKPGVEWSNELACAHARSKILIPIYTGSYFSSPWCELEYDLMNTRYEIAKEQYPEKNINLIIPIIIHRDENLQAKIDRFQHLDLRIYDSPCLDYDKEKYPKFSDKIRDLARIIEVSLKSVPEYCLDNEIIAKAKFIETYEKEKYKQAVPQPSLPIMKI